jgi:hypothetical protein
MHIYIGLLSMEIFMISKNINKKEGPFLLCDCTVFYDTNTLK